MVCPVEIWYNVAMAKVKKVTTIEGLARLMQNEFLGMRGEMRGEFGKVYGEFAKIHKRLDKLEAEVLEIRIELDDLKLRFDQEKVYPFEIKDLARRLGRVETKLGLK